MKNLITTSYKVFQKYKNKNDRASKMNVTMKIKMKEKLPERDDHGIGHEGSKY